MGTSTQESKGNEPVADTDTADTGTADTGTADTQSGTPGRGKIFDLLSNHRRRYAIHHLKQTGDGVELGDLAEHVAAWELDKEREGLTSAERKRVYTSLQQTHLPTLERANVITFDDRTIELTDEAAELDVYLDIVPGDSIPWGTYYFGLSAVGGVVMAGLWLDVIPTEVIPQLGWATLVFALYAVSAVVHAMQSRRMRLGEIERPP